MSPCKTSRWPLWFDTSAKVLRVYNATEGTMGTLLQHALQVVKPAGENAKATMDYDPTIGKLFVNDGWIQRIRG